MARHPAPDTFVRIDSYESRVNVCNDFDIQTFAPGRREPETTSCCPSPRELATRHHVRITGVDPNPEAIAHCRAYVVGDFFAEPFRPERFAPASFDLIVNIGACPGIEPLLAEVSPLLRGDARLLIGDLYWRRAPSGRLLERFGGAVTGSPAPSLAAQHTALQRHGWAVERTLLASTADWDRYEDAYDANMRAHLASHPLDPDASDFEDHRRTWRNLYTTHGRGTLGFSLIQARQVRSRRRDRSRRLNRR